MSFGRKLGEIFRSRRERELQARLAEKEIYLQELHHRVKNDIVILAGYLSLHADRLPVGSAGYAALLEARTRVEGMAKLYDRMSRAENRAVLPAGPYLSDLVEELRRHFADTAGVEIRSDLEDVLLASRKLFPLGLVINELVTNALKHAFPDGRSGVVQVSLRRDAQGDVEAEVADDGIGLAPDTASVQGLGRMLVPALAAQIGGDLVHSNPPGGGTSFRIRIPQG